MYNINSPIVQNMIGGGLTNNPPPSYAMGSNIIGIGSSGYNNSNMGGYYSNNYGMYNPYLYQQKQKEEEARIRVEFNKNAEIMKSISRKVNKILGKEISEERLSEIYTPETLKETEKDKVDKLTTSLIYMDACNQNMIPNNTRDIEICKISDEFKKIYKPDMTLHDFLSNGGEMYSKMLERKALEYSKNNLNQLYNKNDYQKLIDIKTGSINNFGNAFRPNYNPDISDMEISCNLPNHLKNEYQQRRELFLERIINRKGIT